tara:strand:- start:3266 stop:3493 length:228 start_codon:yes stop_codon:yes gene_type:complete
MKEIKNGYEALVVALTLAVTAPTKKESRECLKMAEGLALHLSMKQIEQAKRQAEINLEWIEKNQIDAYGFQGEIA